jgi:hypothetical protein
MRTMNTDQLEAVEVDTEQQERVSDQLFLYALSSQAPWWVVSVMLHALAIVLAGLLTLTIDVGEGVEVAITVTDFAPRKELKETPALQPERDPYAKLASTRDIPPTDPNSPEESTVEVPPDILARAELSDHFETVNPDRPDTQNAFGHPDATMFHSVRGNDDKPGGGGLGGTGLEDLIGAGGMPSRGTGGGWGGGNGTGTGNNDGGGHGSFGRPDGGGRVLRVKRGHGTQATIDGTDRALAWLAYHQEADGRWDAKKYGAEVKTDTACTSFALLAFLGAGHTETLKGPYRGNVQRAVAWLKSKQDADGMIWDTTDDGAHHRAKGYPGAIATLAIVEAAGMGNVADTKAAAQKAINYCTEKHQCGDASDKLGWRYGPKQEGDLSVTGWFVMALKSAKVSGLRVNPAAFDGAIKFLDSVEKKEGGNSGYSAVSHYWYQPHNEHAQSAHRLGAIGNLCRQFMGWKKEDLEASVAYVVQKGGVPSWGANGESVDLYYWYYGSMCLFQQGGELWKKWNEGMMGALVNNQCKQGDEAGSWNPVGAYSAEWGRVGQTALACLCLEVYYRYRLQNGPVQ